jgi:hypothetical protein
MGSNSNELRKRISSFRNTWRHIGIVGFEDRENADPNSPVGMNAPMENDNDDMIDFETAEMEALTDTLEGGFDFQ